MRGTTAGWLGILGLVGCSCGQPASVDGPGPSVPPEPAPLASIDEPPPEVLPAAPEPPREPVVNDATEQAHAAAQARLLRGGERLPALLRTDYEWPPLPVLPAVGLSDHGDEAEGEAAPAGVGPSEAGDESVPEPLPMPGAFVPITDPPRGPALAHFHAALQALQQGRDPDGKVRVAMYGASGTASDLTVGYLRTYLQSRYGDGGPGFVPLVPLSNWYRHSEVKVDASKGWTKEHAQISKGRLDGYYGLLGASFSATKAKRWATVSPKKSSSSSAGIAHVELSFLRQPGGGDFRFRIDQGPWTTVSTAAEAFEPGYHAIDVEPGPHEIRVETLDDREVRVFGVVLERADPGVVVDVLGIDGTRGSNHLTWNETVWGDALARRAPDLYALSYGTNEAVDETLSIPLYAEDFRALLRRYAAVLPEASCVIIGPGDFPIREEGDVLRPRPVLEQVIEVQKQIAAEEGCGFWDGIAFMGGTLSMARWVQSDPPMARKDYLHFTARGSARKGMALADALMYAIDAGGGSPGG